MTYCCPGPDNLQGYKKPLLNYCFTQKDIVTVPQTPLYTCCAILLHLQANEVRTTAVSWMPLAQHLTVT